MVDLPFKFDTLDEAVPIYRKSIEIIHKDEKKWVVINIVFKILSVFLGIISTLFMSLQTDQNQWWSKPIGIVATVLSGGIITFYSTFHVSDNIVTCLSIERILIKNLNDMRDLLSKNPSSASDIALLRKYGDILNEQGQRKRLMWGLVGANEQCAK